MAMSPVFPAKQILKSTGPWIGLLALAAALGACGGGKKSNDETSDEAVEAQFPVKDPFPSTYVPYTSTPTLIKNVTILTGTGEVIDNGSVAMVDGKIAAVGTRIRTPKDATVIDGQGKWVTPGIIDIHSHLGVYPSPSNRSTSDGNEATSPNTAEVWAEHSVWPQDAGFTRALAGGVTSLMVLPGSANLFGGEQSR